MVADHGKNFIDNALSFLREGDMLWSFGIGHIVMVWQSTRADVAPAVKPILFGDAQKVSFQTAAPLKTPFAQVAVEQDKGFLEHILARCLVSPLRYDVLQNPLTPARGAVKPRKQLLALRCTAQKGVFDLFVAQSGLMLHLCRVFAFWSFLQVEAKLGDYRYICPSLVVFAKNKSSWAL